jgi:hypothetical protein
LTIKTSLFSMEVVAGCSDCFSVDDTKYLLVVEICTI